MSGKKKVKWTRKHQMDQLVATQARINGITVEPDEDPLPKKREFAEVMEEIKQNRRDNFLAAINGAVRPVKLGDIEKVTTNLDTLDLSQKDLQDLRFVFEMYADKASKRLTFMDLVMVLKELQFDVTESSLRDIFKKENFKMDQKFELSDLLYCVAKLDLQRDLSSELTLGFKQFDLRGSGRLTHDDLQALNNLSGLALTEQELVDMLTVADRNGDGVVDFSEFSDVLRKTPLFS